MTSDTPLASPVIEAMFARILTSALFAGAAAGLIAALLQLVFVQPVLLTAELYETGQLVHSGAESTVPTNQGLIRTTLLRDGLSIVFTILLYTGYALILVPLMAVAQNRGTLISGRHGLVWGLCGFIAVHFAPGFSLAPEVPGVAAATLAFRQIWWFATVLAASIALWLIAFGRGWVVWALAIALLVAPHAVGAPAPETFAQLVPTELGALFAARAFGVGMVAWVVLGGFAGNFWARGTSGESEVGQPA